MHRTGIRVPAQLIISVCLERREAIQAGLRPVNTVNTCERGESETHKTEIKHPNMAAPPVGTKSKVTPSDMAMVSTAG